MYWTATAALRKNSQPDKPMEDSLAFDQAAGVFCVADGITRSRDREGRYPVVSPASVAARIATDQAIQHMATVPCSCYGEVTVQLQDACRAINRSIHEYALSLPAPDFVGNDLPGAVATLAAIRDSVAYYAHLGDTALFHLGANGELIRMTTDQTSGLERWVRRQAQRGIEDLIIQSRKEFRNSVGFAESFGAFTGEHAALTHVELGSRSLCSGAYLLLMSDGVTPLLTKYCEDSSICRRTLDFIESGKLEPLLQFAEELDIFCKGYSDDKALISIACMA